MPRVTDLTFVKRVLDRDRPWAAYAIGDLAPGFSDQCAWYAPADGAPALLLRYTGFHPPIVFAMGETAQLAPLCRELDAPDISLHVRDGGLAALQPTYRLDATRRLWRMVVEPSRFVAAPATTATPLDESHLDAVTALYDDGHRHHEGPTFFHRSMLGQRTFQGIWEDGALVAVAGTHLSSPDLRVCAIGNVYTRRDRRGLGLAAAVTSAVVTSALAQGITTIVLNVSQDNDRARRVYERLGFRCHCEFFEGEASLRTPS
jgi:ribosomal protein S18 acetylase RimI-like enzyme